MIDVSHPGSVAAQPAITAQSTTFGRDVAALMPDLCGFAYSLCRGRTLASDISQQTFLKAWRAQNSFSAGTNLRAWLFTILRNEFLSHTRRAWRETNWEPEAGEMILAASNEQGWAMELSDLARGLSVLPHTQREALLPVAAGGLSFQQASDNRRTPIGTIKSRVTRARQGLTKVLAGGRPLPPRVLGRGTSASGDILGQLRALMPAVANRAALHGAAL